MKKRERLVTIVAMTVSMFLSFNSSFCCAQSTVATFESDYRSVYGESGDSDRLIRGVWRLEGYGAIVEISKTGLRWFTETSGGSWEDQVVEIPALFFRFDQTGKHYQITLHPLSVAFNATRLETIPDACLEERKWTPTELFEAFVGTMNDYYAFFEERKVDWDGRVAAGRKKLDDQMSQSQLFDVFKSMLIGIDDPHLRLSAKIDGKSARVRLGEAPTLANFREIYDARADKNQTMQQFSTEVQKSFDNGIHQVNLRGKSKRSVNRIVWGRVTDNIGYMFIEGMSRMGEGNIDERLQMVHDAMDEILTELADTDGIIVDLSFNGGGSDLYGKIIASHFADTRRLAMSKGPATRNEYMQDVFIQPYVGKSGKGVTYTKPVFVVTSDITVSAAESFVLYMRCFPHVKTVGSTTRGALSDVLEMTLPNGWDLGISNEVYLDHKGVCHEAVGIEPDIKLDVFEINGSTFTNTAAIANIANTMIGNLQEPDSENDSDPERTQTAEELLARFEKERASIWIDGNMATIIYQGHAASVSVWLGGQLLPLECAPNSDVWYATREFANLNAGMLNYSFLVTKTNGAGGQTEKTAASYWRGPAAPKPPAVASELKGEIKNFELKSDNLANGKRKLSVYLPPGFETLKSPAAAVYMADGGSVELYAAVAEPLILAGKIPPLVFVGVHSGGYLGEHRPDLSDFDASKDLRSAEYLPAFGSEHFAGHEQFFCEEVVAWAEEKFGLSDSRQQRLVLGHSNGARFAVTMGIRHADLFGRVIGLSVAAGEPPVFESDPKLKASFYLAAGTWEDRFHELTKEFHKSIKQARFKTFFSSRVAGHDEKMWQEEFATGIVRAFGMDDRNTEPLTRDKKHTESRQRDEASNHNPDAKLQTVSETIQGVMAAHDIPAVSIGIVADGEVHFLNFGTTNRQPSDKVSQKSIYQIASLGKAFVGIVVRKLILDGKIKLDDPITKYLPEDMPEKTRTKLQPITIRHLLHHRSGLPRISPMRKKDKSLAVNVDYSGNDFVTDLNRMKLRYTPGELFEYSNFGFSLLAYVCERASGKTYDELLKLHVADCYQMANTTVSLSEAQMPSLVTAYHNDNRSQAVPPWVMGKLAPASAVYSTTEDLAALLEKQLKAYRQNLTNQSSSPLLLTHSTEDAWAGTGISYGFGFFDWGNGTYGHGGGMDGYGSDYTLNPEKDYGFVLLTSSCGPWTNRLSQGLNRILGGDEGAGSDEIVAVEQIVAAFNTTGQQAALETYQRLRKTKPSPLGEEARLAIINLAKQYRLDDATRMFLDDAMHDFPESEKIKSAAKAFGSQENRP